MIPDDLDLPPNAKSWPPKPVRPRLPKTLLIESREMLGLLTNFFLWDFLLGLVAGGIAFFLLLFACGIVVEWFVPKLPVPKSVQWFDWSFTTLAVAVIFVVFVRRYVYLMVGFATTALLLSVIGWFLVMYV